MAITTRVVRRRTYGVRENGSMDGIGSSRQSHRKLAPADGAEARRPRGLG